MTVFDRLRDVLADADVVLTGVVHVGAHRGQELPAYQSAGAGTVLWIEPNPRYAAELTSRGAQVVCCAAGAAAGVRTMWATKWSQRHSLHRPVGQTTGSYLTAVLPVRCFDTAGCNMLVIDVQGAELEVLHGTDLDRFDLAIVETRTDGRYEHAASPDQVGDWLRTAGWEQRSVWPHGGNGVRDEVWVRCGR